MRVRSATLADVVPIAGLEAAEFGELAWSEDAVRAELSADSATRVVLAADRGDLLVGYAVLAISGPCADVRRIAVAQAAQRLGIGTALLTRVLATAAERGCAEAFLEVRAGNAAAAALYSRFGFELVYQRPRYYPDGSDALVMHVGLPGSRRAP